MREWYDQNLLRKINTQNAITLRLLWLLYKIVHVKWLAPAPDA